MLAFKKTQVGVLLVFLVIVGLGLSACGGENTTHFTTATTISNSTTTAILSATTKATPDTPTVGSSGDNMVIVKGNNSSNNTSATPTSNVSDGTPGVTTPTPSVTSVTMTDPPSPVSSASSQGESGVAIAAVVASSSGGAAASPTPPPVPSDPPIRLDIPKIGLVNRTVSVVGTEPLVVNKGTGQTVQAWQAPPPQQAGWHRDSGNVCTGYNATPVINGHNYWGGQAIFWRLAELEAGDKVQVKSVAGLSCEYTVLTRKQYGDHLDTSWLAGGKENLPSLSGLSQTLLTSAQAAVGGKEVAERDGYGFLTIYTCDSQFVGRVVLKLVLTSKQQTKLDKQKAT